MFFRPSPLVPIIASFLLLTGLGCDTILDSDPSDAPEEAEPIGLQDAHVSEMVEMDGHVYAATSEGVFRAGWDDGLGEWTHLGPEDFHVNSMARLPDGELMAGLRPMGDDVPASLYRSTGDRSAFEPYQQNYGGDYEPRSVIDLTADPFRPDTLYARGAMHVARTTDAGESWNVIYGNWDSAGYQADVMEVHPLDPDTLWAGGETAIFQPYLLRSEDLGESWDMIEIDTGGDNASYSLAFHPSDPERMLLGMEGRIKRSDDHGDSWTRVFDNDLYHYIHVMESPGDEPGETVYASGTENGAQGGGLFYLRTTDFGDSWTKVRADADLDGLSINDLLIRETGGERAIYLATSEGIWRMVSR